MSDNDTTPEGDSATPSPTGADLAKLFPQLAGMSSAQLAQLASQIDWRGIDLECPQAFLEIVGAELEEMFVGVIKCECGQKVRVRIDGDKLNGCPKCKAVFRTLLVVQSEDVSPSGAALAVEAILASNR